MQQARARALVSRVFQSSFISCMPDTSPIIFRPTGNFYGSPDETLHLSDYAELNDFNEIARNILPGVNYPGTGQKIRILDNASHVMQKEEALVFVNGIPFPDPAFVSKLDSRQVRKIDLKRHHLLYGNLDIAGILAISTREQDLYPLDPRMASLVYPNPVNDRIPKLSGPVYEGAGKWPENLPDFRQTLFWEPAVNLTDGKAELEFWTPDVRGTYTIRVEGITGNGQTVSATLDFKVN